MVFPDTVDYVPTILCFPYTVIL